jgi:deoxyribodipyrimidine photo-lyase
VYEQQRWDWLQRASPGVRFVARNGHTLYARNQLPFSLDELPRTFTPFRERVEALNVPIPRPAPRRLPRPPLMPAEWISRRPAWRADAQASAFRGGTDSGRAQLRACFSGLLPLRYKEVRNALDGWENSSKWSPWLANGSLSVREVLHALRDYERRAGGNESTYWLFFELLWREYFQWYAMAHGRRLFAFAGTRRRRPLTSFYPERFACWSAGSTPYPLVNACMKQLNATGYLSNRGRQIAASCLVNELSLDWRYGAAYFEQQLVDYDVAVNWGNWQYLAGVGADPRGQRHFDLDRQAAQFDPDGAFVARWAGAADVRAPLDSVDAADWPIGGAMQQA